MNVKQNMGIFIREDGKVFSDRELKNEIIPMEDQEGYLFIPDEELAFGGPSSPILSKTGQVERGKYVHRMMVFAFGDRNGTKYDNSLVIDHIDMNHKNNSLSNLEQISKERNLFRAYYKTRSTEMKSKFLSIYTTLDEIDKKILDFEIEHDIKEILKRGRWQ